MYIFIDGEISVALTRSKFITLKTRIARAKLFIARETYPNDPRSISLLASSITGLTTHPAASNV